MSQTSHACWSCKGPARLDGFCPTCSALQPPDLRKNFFQLFDLPRAFVLDVAALELLYREAQRQVHPDKFAAKSSTERRLSMEYVTRLNEAYRTLKDELNRAVYLLELHGIHAGSEEGGAAPADPMFLMEVMELRERLEAANDFETLDALRGEVEGLEGGEVAALENAFSGEDLDAARKHADRLRYHRRFLEELDRREESLF